MVMMVAIPSDDKKKEFVDIINANPDGMSLYDISQKTGVSYPTLKKWAEELGYIIEKAVIERTRISYIIRKGR